MRQRSDDWLECGHNTHCRNMKMDYETWEEYEAREVARKRDEKPKKKKKKFNQIPPPGDLDDDWTDAYSI